MTSALRKQTSKPASFLHAPAPPTLSGTSGSTSVKHYTSILPYKSSKIQYLSSKSSLTDIGMVNTPAKNRSALEPWKAPYEALAKRSQAWGPRTRALHSRATSTSVSNGNSLATRSKTRLLTV
jgi:hypothetical protein